MRASLLEGDREIDHGSAEPVELSDDQGLCLTGLDHFKGPPKARPASHRLSAGPFVGDHLDQVPPTAPTLAQDRFALSFQAQTRGRLFLG